MCLHNVIDGHVESLFGTVVNDIFYLLSCDK